MDTTDTALGFGSDEYAPTPSHALPALGRHGKGFICPSCGHLESNIDDSPFDDICPKCAITALRRLNVPTMITIKEFHKNIDEALEPTVKIDKPEKPSNERTTQIYKIWGD